MFITYVHLYIQNFTFHNIQFFLDTPVHMSIIFIYLINSSFLYGIICSDHTILAIYILFIFASL